MNKELIGRSIKETFTKPLKFVKENPTTFFEIGLGSIAIASGSIGIARGYSFWSTGLIASGSFLCGIVLGAEAVKHSIRPLEKKITIVEHNQPKL